MAQTFKSISQLKLVFLMINTDTFDAITVRFWDGVRVGYFQVKFIQTHFKNQWSGIPKSNKHSTRAKIRSHTVAAQRRFKAFAWMPMWYTLCAIPLIQWNRTNYFELIQLSWTQMKPVCLFTKLFLVFTFPRKKSPFENSFLLLKMMSE